jgi:HEAT repeat protein
VLRGLDEIDWAALGSATGTADGLPDMLRAIAAGVEPDAGEAVDDLVNEVFHQHTVWECTDPAVPFIVELVVDPSLPHRASLVYLLGGLSYEGVLAVVPHVPRLVPLLDDPDEDVRECAAYLVGWHDGHAELTVPVLLRRYADEPVPLVRASVLAAIGALDLDRGRSLVEAALHDPDPVLRAAAGWVLVRMREWYSEEDVPVPPGILDAVSSAFADGDPLQRWTWSFNAQSEFLDGIADVPGARDAMFASLVRSPSAQTRRYTLFDVGDRIRSSRAAPARLVPLLGPLMSDEDAKVRDLAATTARQAGSAARLVVDDLAELAARLPADDAAEPALSTLVDLGDPRWRPMLLDAWRSSRPLTSAAKALKMAAPAADAELVDAVAARIVTQVEVAARVGWVGEEVDALAGLVGHWRAAPVAPGLIAALEFEVGTDRPTPGAICAALAELGADASPALPALRTAAARSFHGYDRISAALAVWRLTGDVGPALEVGALMLNGPDGYDEALQAWIYPAAVTRLLPLGAALVPLEPHLRRHIADHPQRHKSNSELARVLWHLHGDADEVIPVLRAALSFTNHRDEADPPSEAIRAALELGDRAAPLLDPLRRGLGSPTAWVRADAATALVRLDAGDPAELVAAIVPKPSPYHRWWASSALQALADIAELRLVPAGPRLRAWLETDERVQGSEDERVRLDERFQARAREVVAGLA